MKPITFPEANRTFVSPAGEEDRVYPLVAHFDPSIPQVTECWRPSLRERLSVLFFGRVWVRFLAHSPQPVKVDGRRTIFFELDLNERIDRSLAEIQEKRRRDRGERSPEGP